ncbi:MAG: endonuclease [Bacteroidetes bacterium]|nr:endonuclease [Bacteroidota bacterium]
MTKMQGSDSSENHAKVKDGRGKSQIVRVVFYNLENLYDPYDDTTRLDDEFTSKGAKRWTYSKFLLKLNHVAKTFLAIGGWEPPAIIGMCELENRYVLNKLIYETPIKRYGYKFIHYDSPDARGIDVALLYRLDRFKVIHSKNIRISFPFDTMMRTRDILYVKGILFTTDTVNIFVNHWPSRRGGFKESVPKRMLVAGKLRSLLDSLLHHDKQSKIIIMGDFNDEPDQPSIREVLHATEFTPATTSDSIVNLMIPKMRDQYSGTYKFQGKWSIIDQFMVSGSLLLDEKGVRTSPESVHIFNSGFLTEEDERFFGTRPQRTYAGPRYLGGFSDHLPIYLDLWHE